MNTNVTPFFNQHPYIIIIDDNIKDADSDPLVGELELIYPKENIKIFQTPKKGIEFIENNLDNKMIVLLGVMFGNKKPEGFKVFDTITEKTSLVCFILMTGNIESIDRSQLINLINKHAWYFVQRDEDSEEFIKIIKKAEDYINCRVDSALEYWITKHSLEEREAPYLKTKSGKIYTLDKILSEIRKGTQFGLDMQKDIIELTIYLLTKEKKLL